MKVKRYALEEFVRKEKKLCKGGKLLKGITIFEMPDFDNVQS